MHDLRALFATASLAQGRSDTWVRERGRWETPQMLDRYRRQVPHFRKYGPITPMVEAVPEVAASAAALEIWPGFGAGNGGNQDQGDAGTGANATDSPQFQRMDSNHDKRNQNPLSCH